MVIELQFLSTSGASRHNNYFFFHYCMKLGKPTRTQGWEASISANYTTSSTPSPNYVKFQAPEQILTA